MANPLILVCQCNNTGAGFDAKFFWPFEKYYVDLHTKDTHTESTT